jgi:prevent-host-death family protein
MQTINMHEAKTQLSRLVDLAVQGEDFIIAKAGKPLVKVTRVDAPAPKLKRKIGFMLGQVSVPDDFDTMGQAEIDRLFNQAI